MTVIARWQVIKLGEDTYAAHGILIEGPRCEDQTLVRESDYDALAAQHRGAVSLSDSEWDRVLYWLRKPIPPGPMKMMDEAIIRKITNRGQS